MNVKGPKTKLNRMNLYRAVQEFTGSGLLSDSQFVSVFVCAKCKAIHRHNNLICACYGQNPVASLIPLSSQRCLLATMVHHDYQK